MVLFKLHRHRVIFYCLLLLQKKGRFCWGQETCALYAETVQKNPIVITQMSNTISVTGFLLIFLIPPFFFREIVSLTPNTKIPISLGWEEEKKRSFPVSHYILCKG